MKKQNEGEEKMSFEDQLRKLRHTSDELQNQSKQDPKVRFVNEKILPPLFIIQREFIRTESAIYLSPENTRLPYSPSNLPKIISLYWGKLDDIWELKWSHCFDIVVRNKDKKVFVPIDPGNKEIENISGYVILDQEDIDFINKYRKALLLCVQHEMQQTHASNVPDDYQLLEGQNIM